MPLTYLHYLELLWTGIHTKTWERKEMTSEQILLFFSVLNTLQNLKEKEGIDISDRGSKPYWGDIEI